MHFPARKRGTVKSFRRRISPTEQPEERILMRSRAFMPEISRLGPQEKALFLREGAHFTWEEARVRPQRFFPRLIRDLRQCAEKIEHGRLTELPC